MTIDEVLTRIKDKMACDYHIKGCDTCDISSCEDKDIIIQLSEWLEELNILRLQNHLGRDEAYNAGYNKAHEELEAKYQELVYQAEINIRNKAIDDLMRETMNVDNIYVGLDYDRAIMVSDLNMIAEQLKGEKNEQ